jgi:hypothetical protein
MKKAAVTVLILLLARVLMAAGEPMAFLKLGAGVRATGMGGAYTAVSDDAAGVFYNPAGIVAVKSLHFSAETYLLSFGRNVNYISVCRPFNLGGHYYSAGLSWFNYSAGSDIEARSTNSPLPERSISDASHLVILTAATGISDRLYAGINAKLDLRVLDDVKGTGFGFDAGIMLKIIEGLSAGVCVSNLSANAWWDNRQYNEPLPQIYNFGLSYSRGDIFGVPELNALASVDYVLNTFGFMKLKIGAEISANKFLFLRTGYNGAFSAGCGVVFKPSEKFSLKIDYALSADTIVEASLNHRIGLTLDFMTDKKDPEAGVKTPAPAEKQKGEKNEEEPW